MKIPVQPAGEPAGLIRKYYPRLREHLPSPTLPDLAAEWYSGLSQLGIEDLDYYVAERYERASNKTEFTDCVAMLLAEVEQHAHLPGYGYRRHPPDYLTPEREAEIVANGRATLRAVREWHTQAILSPVQRFLERAYKIELWQNDLHQLATREARHEEWREEYNVLLRALQRAVPTAKRQLLRAAYTELKQLLPTLAAGRPLEWQRIHDEGYPFLSIVLTTTYPHSEFAPLRPTQNSEIQVTEHFFQYLYIHLFEKEWHVWQALILLAGVLGEAAPPKPETFQKKQPKPAPSSPRPEQAPAAAGAEAPTVGCPFAPLLLNYTLAKLTVLLSELGLIDKTTRQPTSAVSPGAWVGVIYALIDEKCPRLRPNKAAARRAFAQVFRAVVSESAVHTGLNKQGSEAERFRDRALALLKG